MGKGPFKISMLGDWRSGRSSIVSVLSGKPCPNHPGIQVTRWTAPADGSLLEIWDVNSRSTLETLGQTFLFGADALVAVGDATRAESVQAACDALRAAQAILGPRPTLLLLNKLDSTNVLPELPDAIGDGQVMQVSARSGDGVVAAFSALAQRLANGRG